MQIKSFLMAFVAVASVFAQAPDPAINTPEGVTECLPVLLTFSGSAPPFIITVQPGGQAGAAPLTTIGTTSSDSITWLVNLPAGTQCTLVIRDSLGRTNPSAEFTILAGPSTTCTAASSDVAATGATTAVGASTTAAGVVTTPVITTTVPTTTAVAATTVAAVTTHAATTIASAAATTTSKSGASSLQPMCLAGLMGLVGAAALL